MVKKCSFLWVCCLLVASCQSHGELDKQDKSMLGQEYNEIEPVKLIENRGATFSYALSDTVEVGPRTYINIACLVVNSTKNQMLYLEESCNGLEYFLESLPQSYEANPLIYCNVSWPMISILKPGDSLHFTSRLLLRSRAAELQNLGLDFRVVDKYIPFETLKENPALVKEAFAASTFPVNVVWAE